LERLNYKFSPKSIDYPAIAFWGYRDRKGQIKGDEVKNFVPWFIKNIQCIPVLTDECKKSSSVLLNKEDITAISGKYLPVFNGPKLSPDWKSFFNFRTNLQLTDYLDLLYKISLDIDDKGKIKNDNYKRIQSIYSELLEQCANFSSKEISEVNEWAITKCLLNTKLKFTECSTLKYFIDGNESIFQDQFTFLEVSEENINHPNFEDLLTYFKVKILKQNNFELIHSTKKECYSLINHLMKIIPYFKIWIKNEASDNKIRENLENIELKIGKLNIYEADELKIKYAKINFIKNVNVHFNNTNIYITSPWTTNSVLMKLPEVLCRYFHLLGHDKKLDFLLRSSENEIQNYFAQENIRIPDETSDIQIEQTLSKQIQEQRLNSLAGFENFIKEGREPLAEFFHTSVSDYKKLKHAEKIILRAVFNVKKHLEELPEYNCSYAYKLANSIIGGITKNGNEITVVARPSDNGEVLPYYSSEFDVLEYVDAEFWCEDGINIPKQITLGQLLKKTGINRIPIKNIEISNSDIETLFYNPKSEILDFNAVPFAPEKIARIISSFANTEGGTLIFGLKKNSPTKNIIVGLSTDFKVVEVTKKAILQLSPTPTISYDWLKRGEKLIFIIKTEKAEHDILLENKKYITGQS